jgi:hypothetical protein
VGSGILMMGASVPVNSTTSSANCRTVNSFGLPMLVGSESQFRKSL